MTPVDKYILLRWDDYKRLISNQTTTSQIDIKTFHHDQEHGLREQTNAPVGNIYKLPTSQPRQGVITGSGGNEDADSVITDHSFVTSKNNRVNDRGRKLPTNYKGKLEGLADQRLVGDHRKSSWAREWEGIHFSK